MPIDYGERLPIDPRAIRRIQGSPQMLAEQGPGFYEIWGGPRMYRRAAKLRGNTRIAYYAVKKGYQTAEEIEMATRLSLEEAEAALDSLEQQGLITHVS